MRRALLAVVVAIGFGLAAPAGAQEAEQAGWSGGITAVTVEGGSITISGAVRLNRPLVADDIERVAVTVAPAAGALPGCGSVEGAQAFPQREETVEFSVTVTPPCNGVYTVSAVAYAVSPADATTYAMQYTEPVPPISERPPAVTEVTVGMDGRVVTVSWAPSYGTPPPDFVGYRVMRSLDDAGAEVVSGDAPILEPSFVDSAVPDSGGTLQYLVVALRVGADGTVLESEPSSSGPNSIGPVVVPPPPTSPLPPPRPPRTTRTTARTAQASLPPSPITTQTLPESELEEDIVLADIEPGDPEAVLPDDDFATGTIISRDERQNPYRNRALLVPIAIGASLLGWSLLLRFLTRQALATTAGADLDAIEVVPLTIADDVIDPFAIDLAPPFGADFDRDFDLAFDRAFGGGFDRPLDLDVDQQDATQADRLGRRLVLVRRS